MCCLAGCSKPSPPSGSGGGTGVNDGGPNKTDGGACADGSSPPCTCPPVEIQVNNTATANDDLVGLKCEHPGHRSKVSCRIRSTGAGATKTIVLTNPDGRLRFPDSVDATKTVTLPNDGSWVSFEISGERPSAAIGDAVIEAHCQTATGELKGSKPVTVFWFDEVKIQIARGGNYRLVGGRYQVVGAHAVDYSAQARIRPAGVDCTAPQVTNLRVGILQNGLAGVVGRTTWDSPAITWNPGVPPGTRATVPQAMRLTTTQPTDANDSEASVAPLYDQPGKAQTIDGNSLKPPIGCAGAAAATSNDAPSASMQASFVAPAVDSAGLNVGQVTYHFKNMTIEGGFITWVVIFDIVSNVFCALRQRGWHINVDSAGAGPQKATPDASDAAAASDPLTAAPFANTLVNNPGNSVTVALNAAATKTFTK